MQNPSQWMPTHHQARYLRKQSPRFDHVFLNHNNALPSGCCPKRISGYHPYRLQQLALLHTRLGRIAQGVLPTSCIVIQAFELLQDHAPLAGDARSPSFLTYPVQTETISGHDSAYHGFRRLIHRSVGVKCRTKRTDPHATPYCLCHRTQCRMTRAVMRKHVHMICCHRQGILARPTKVR